MTIRYRRFSFQFAVLRAVQAPRASAAPWPMPRRVVAPSDHAWIPDVDVHESRTTITIVAELAGVREDDIELVLYDDAVVIEGARRNPEAVEPGVYHLAAIQRGPFRAEIVLPAPVEKSGVRATLDDGLLIVSLRRLTRD